MKQSKMTDSLLKTIFKMLLRFAKMMYEHKEVFGHDKNSWAEIRQSIAF